MKFFIRMILPVLPGFDLGKKIFYEGRLSSDGTISCGFCHIQRHAFTHHGHSLSHGVDDQVGKRNAPPIQNMAYLHVFMWDGAADNLDLQPIVPITSAVEMHGNLTAIVAMMNADADYRANEALNDLGREEFTFQASDRLKFRVPSLRNIAQTAPYMHDGRFYTLKAVLNHYASAVVDSPTLDASLRNGSTLGIPLSEDEKTAIIAFLQTLKDTEFLSDPRFSEF